MFKNISKQQKSNLVALAISLLVMGGIALKSQQNCWEQNGVRMNMSSPGFFAKLSRGCTPGPYQPFTPPSEIKGLVYVPKANATSQFYVRTGRN